MHLAAIFGNKAAVIELLKMGAGSDKLNNHGETAQQLATSYENADIANAIYQALNATSERLLAGITDNFADSDA